MQPSPLTWMIALLALVFTVGSFWWLNARRGRIIVYPVSTFTGMMNLDGIRLHLPIVIYNTGAAPRIVRELRLQTVDAEGNILHLVAQSFRKKLDVKNDSFDDFTHPFVVTGRGVKTKFVTFTAMPLPPLHPGKPMSFTLQVKLDESDSWQGIKTLDVHVGLLMDFYNTWSNDKAHWHEKMLKDSLFQQEILMDIRREERQRLMVSTKQRPRS